MAVLVAASVVAGCDGRGDIEVTSSTSRAVEPLPPRGPEPGTFERDWRTEVDAPRPRVVGGQLVTRLDDGLRAYDARTGKPAWQYREPNRDLMGYAATDGVIVVNTTNAGDSINSWHTVGLKASTGEILWETTDRWYLTYGDDTVGNGKPGVAAGGTVVVRSDEDERLGIDVHTGDERWEISGEGLAGEHCALTERANSPGGGAVVPIRVDCNGPDDVEYPQLLAVLDAATGEPRWATVADSVETETETRGGVTLVDHGEDATVEVRGPNGTRLFTAPPGTSCGSHRCELLRSGPFRVFRYPAGEGADERLVAIDTRNGRHRELPQPDFTVGPLGAWVPDHAGRLYRLGTLATGEAELLPPRMLEVIDLRRATIRRSPLPIAVAVGVVDQRALLTVTGDRLLMYAARREGASVASYTRTGGGEPYELGGVSPREWPDPCRLLAGIPHEEGAAPEGGGPVRVASRTIPRTSCVLDTPEGEVEVTVIWMAPDAAQADALFDGSASPLPGADEQDRRDAYRARYRVGPVIIDVLDRGTELPVTERIVRQLRDLLGR